MPSMMGLLDQEERAARRRVEALREESDRLLAELDAAESAWQRLVITRETVGRLLTAGLEVEPEGRVEPSVPAGEAVAVRAPVRPARAGSVVPVWRPGLGPGVLAVEYQQLLAVLADDHQAGGAGLKCQEIAKRLGIELTPSKVEGAVRSRAKRLAERGWVSRLGSGTFRLAAGPAGAS